jgi:hypothetical protein
MKISNSEIIRDGEHELFDAITGDLDWGVVERIFKERHGLQIEEDVEYKGGDIIVHNDQIAYSLKFEAKVTLSILLDREGNHIAVSPIQDAPEDPAPGASGRSEEPEAPEGGGYEKILADLDVSEPPKDEPEDPSPPDAVENDARQSSPEGDGKPSAA